MSRSATPSDSPPVELEFGIRDRECFFVGVSAEESCHVSLEHLVRRSDGRLLEFFAVSGAAPDRVLARAEATPGIDRARLLERGAESALYGLLVSGPCVTTTLADADAVARSVTATDGEGRVVASVPDDVSVREVVETFEARHAETDLVARRESGNPVPVRTERGTQATLGSELTAKQQEVLRTAFENGYFEWPRETSAEECAATLDISQPTFSQHIRAAERKVFGALFDERSPRS